MKAGDILMSAAKTVPSLGIRVGTVSTFSHTAIAISETEVFEATAHGVSTITLDAFLQTNSEVVLFSRPEQLSLENAARLKDTVSKLQGRSYTVPKSLLSGVARIGLYVIPICIAITFLTSLISNRFIAVLPALCLMMLLGGVFYLAAKPVRLDALLKKLRLNCLMSKSDTYFCSDLVMNIDKEIGGDIHYHCSNIHDPRPKDISSAAKKLGFAVTVLKLGAIGSCYPARQRV